MPNSPLDTDAESEEFQIPVLDMDLVIQIYSQALLDQNYSSRNRSGLLVADVNLLKIATLTTMEDHHVATGAKDMTAKAVTAFELYSEVLPTGPGVTSIPDSEEAKEAKKKLQSTVWGFTNTGTSGYVQKGVGSTGLVLCEAPVARNLINEETGKKEPTNPLGRFLTADHPLILLHYVKPAGMKFVKAARELENKLGMVTTRQPELALPVARNTAAIVKQAVASIPSANPNTVASSGSGEAST